MPANFNSLRFSGENEIIYGRMMMMVNMIVVVKYVLILFPIELTLSMSLLCVVDCLLYDESDELCCKQRKLAEI